mgnify:CR=1 FL=1
MRLPSSVQTVAGSEDVCRASAVLSPSVVGLSCRDVRVDAIGWESRTNFLVDYL